MIQESANFCAQSLSILTPLAFCTTCNIVDPAREPEKQHAPALSYTACRLLASIAVHDGWALKQGDCKLPFCHGILPEDEIVIVKPPRGSPQSKQGVCWRLKKTLCGLARSVRRWHGKIEGELRKFGFESMPHNRRLFRAKPLNDQPRMADGAEVRRPGALSSNRKLPTTSAE